eukprot:CAMPEP_0170200212 /NCGR_PEP_ID=MMETSP0040_2-20121228/69752_1 /TAXON_ID=641309 /ORGANISM="Lotharella oceanica, Strain CCMP622" /LENGTH=322 /DNA_ID=CAMNT_0010450389 /DNA_START=65 /DNA_END=1031 /DNA_ORIENTATION=-
MENEDVAEMLEEWGPIADIRLIRDKKTTLSKGFGFVRYEDWRSGVMAIDNLNGFEVNGRILRVNHAPDYRNETEQERYVERWGGTSGKKIHEEIQQRATNAVQEHLEARRNHTIKASGQTQAARNRGEDEVRQILERPFHNGQVDPDASTPDSFEARPLPKGMKREPKRWNKATRRPGDSGGDQESDRESRDSVDIPKISLEDGIIGPTWQEKLKNVDPDRFRWGAEEVGEGNDNIVDRRHANNDHRTGAVRRRGRDTATTNYNSNNGHGNPNSNLKRRHEDGAIRGNLPDGGRPPGNGLHLDRRGDAVQWIRSGSVGGQDS